VTTTLFRWLSMTLFVVLIFSSFVSAIYLNSSIDEIMTGPGAIIPILTGGVAVGSLALALKSSKSELRRSWMCLLIGFGMWVLADLIWGVEEIWNLTKESYFPFADFLWIAGYVLIAAAIWYYLPGLGNLLRDRWKVVVVVLVCLLPLVVLMIQLITLLRTPIIREEGSTALFPVIYPVLDMVLAAGGLLIAIYSRRQVWRWPWLVIGAALVLWAYSDTWYAIATVYEWFTTRVPIRLSVDLTYSLAYLILAVGALLSLQNDLFSID